MKYYIVSLEVQDLDGNEYQMRLAGDYQDYKDGFNMMSRAEAIIDDQLDITNFED